MSIAQTKNELTKASPLSIIKIKQNPNSSFAYKKIQLMKTNNKVETSPGKDCQIQCNFSARQNKTSRYRNNLPKYFKNEIRTHEKQLKKNTRMKLIQNTQKLIKDRNSTFDNYILHSTKRLKIIADNLQSQRQQKNRSFIFNTTAPSQLFVSLPEKNQQMGLKTEDSIGDCRKRTSQQNKRIFKGITSRKNYRAGRFSLELEKYKVQQQNAQDFLQLNHINLYQSLIYGGTVKPIDLTMPLSELQGGKYAKIDRSKYLPAEEDCLKRKGKTREGDKIVLNDYSGSGFPTKKIESNEPEVLTIHIKRQQNKFGSTPNGRQEKNSSHYYRPRGVALSNINIFKRPNTTLANTRIPSRRDSEIEPW